MKLSSSIAMLMLYVALSCNDGDNPANCRVVEVFESQDYEHGGEKLKYEFKFTGERLIQVDKFVILDGVSHLFFSTFYQYDQQDHITQLDRKDAKGSLLYFTQLTYTNDLLVGYVVQNTSSLSREERTLRYDTDKNISRVDYSYYKEGETEPFESFYVTPQYAGEKVNVSYFDLQDQFTGSIEVTLSTQSTIPNTLPLLFEQYFHTPFFLLPSVPVRLVYKDQEGNISETLTYDYTIEGGLLKNFKLNQGIRSDLFEFSYQCR